MAKATTTVGALSVAQNKKVSEQLVKIFLSENPPADFVETVPSSVRPVDAKFHLYKALVRTDVYIGGVKQHTSNIRFKTDSQLNVIPNSITFS